MDGILEAIKMSFSGLLNWGTLVGLIGGVLIYSVLSAFTTYEENKEYLMGVFARLQIWIGAMRAKRAKKVARWLWTEIIELDYERRCQLAKNSPDEEYRIWLLLQLPYFGFSKKLKLIKRTCRAIMTTPGISKRLAKVVQICLKKVEES